jgi:hypothetical protein
MESWNEKGSLGITDVVNAVGITDHLSPEYKEV